MTLVYWHEEQAIVASYEKGNSHLRSKLNVETGYFVLLYIILYARNVTPSSASIPLWGVTSSDNFLYTFSIVQNRGRSRFLCGGNM